MAINLWTKWTKSWIDAFKEFQNKGAPTQEEAPNFLNQKPTPSASEDNNTKLMEKVVNKTEKASTWPEPLALGVWRAVFEWAQGFIENTLESSRQIFTWLASAWEREVILPAANAVRRLLGKPEITEKDFEAVQWPAEGLTRTGSEDLLDVGEGVLWNTLTAAFPLATLNLNIAWETEIGKDLLEWVAWAMIAWGDFINKAPWLKTFRDSLPEDRKDDFNAFTWQLVTLGFFKSLEVIRGKKIKPTEKPESQTTGRILRPTKKELEIGLGESAEIGLARIIKETKTTAKTFAEQLEIVKTKNSADFIPLKTWIKAAEKKLGKKWLVKNNETVTWVIEQMIEITEGRTSAQFRALNKEYVTLLEKANGKWITLSELQKLKQDHTAQNNLFTEKGTARGKTFSGEDLRAARTEIKELLEVMAEKGWFKDVKEINTKFSEGKAAEFILKERVGELGSATRKLSDKTALDKIVGWTLEVVQLAKVGRAIKRFFEKAEKVNITEVEALLQKLTRELRGERIPESSIKKIMNEVTSAMRLSPAVTDNWE